MKNDLFLFEAIDNIIENHCFMNAIVDSHTLAENGNQAISIYTEIESLHQGGFKITIRQMILKKESGKRVHKQIYSKTVKPED